MITCPNCGAENEDRVSFCMNCGQEMVKKSLKIKPEKKTSILLIIFGYLLSILGIFSLGILSVVGLIIGIVLYRRGDPDRIHGIIITVISIIIVILVILAIGALFIYRSYFHMS